MIILEHTDGYLATVEIAHDGEGAILTICEEEEGHTRSAARRVSLKSNGRNSSPRCWPSMPSAAVTARCRPGIFRRGG